MGDDRFLPAVYTCLAVIVFVQACMWLAAGG
jgi:hypothetical protein